MSSAQMDPHDKMRSRDISKVARGQQAPRPAHTPGTVSPPPQNEATFRAKRGEDSGESGEEVDSTVEKRFPVTNETRHCFNRFMQYNKCIEKNGRDAYDCNNLRDYVRSMCPKDLVSIFWLTSGRNRESLGHCHRQYED
ncbi:putative cytochrome c oxidase subunit 6b-like [Arabidopsis lyrata subsp. lyrata]|uniref:putative cytochrome c oxidase subunit 6b-like n=1 Tax=Arabidopsis lyrata subsp. lyrata TaxID=81972 RepID=UPI000A29D585|nr:putative cytochrome c oxidase subunit 6b-like [Arabidopsis lyrata subsp. lyrata]|eukprot:XP_020870376.1 putative cytochrome c oxidase subunit 6b-like [Arabidopsis lyrata subsp. lyrata]